MDFLIGVDVARRSTVQEYPLGSLAMAKRQNDTTKIYIYGQANSTMTAGQVGPMAGGTETSGHQVALLSTTSSAPGTGQGKPVVVADSAISASEYGWFLIYGSTTVSALASCAAYTQLNSTGTSGALDDDATAGSEVIDGIVLRSTNGGSTAVVNAIVNFPRVGRTL